VLLSPQPRQAENRYAKGGLGSSLQQITFG